jgi:hypothetical protein
VFAQDLVVLGSLRFGIRDKYLDMTSQRLFNNDNEVKIFENEMTFKNSIIHVVIS